MTALLRLCRRLTDRNLVPLRVTFTDHRNDGATELSRFSGCRVEFTSDCLTFGAA